MCMTFFRWLPARPSPMASMIWSTTVGSSTWASIMTRLNLRWRVSGDGGTSRAKRSILARANCSSPPMGAGPTGSEIVYGRRNCRSLPMILPRISGRVKSSDILSRRRKRVMQKVQKTYTTEFKREAVHLAQTSGKPITQIARELGISDTSIHQWRKELTEHGPEAFPGSGHQTAQEEELRRLKRELERTQKERDILKKALAIFSQNPL